MKNIVIIIAAGAGKRMGGDRPKQHLDLCGKPILCHTLDRFHQASMVDAVIIVTDVASIDTVRQHCSNSSLYPKVRWIVAGGEKRQDSVHAGLKAVPAGAEIVAVHDGVRPFVNPQVIDKSFEVAGLYGACIVAIPVKDTIKRADSMGRIIETVERTGLWRAQTPQTFKYEILEMAMDQAMSEGFYGTDEAVLVERLGHEICILPGDERNIKITTPDDFLMAKTFIQTV